MKHACCVLNHEWAVIHKYNMHSQISEVLQADRHVVMLGQCCMASLIGLLLFVKSSTLNTDSELLMKPAMVWSDPPV